MNTKEKHIISGLQLGNEETYIFLFREYYVQLCAYSHRYLRRKDWAEEVVSETFFKIWQNRHSLHITGSVKSYLFQAVYNNSLYFLRKMKREKEVETYCDTIPEESLDISFMELSEQDLIMEDIYSRIESAVDQLPAQQQKAFRLKRFEGKKIKEVAEIMGLSVKTVEMHLSKAMSTLR